ncbi:MAG: recombinase family protein, partial [bacterium]
MVPRRKQSTPESVRGAVYTRVSTPDQAEGEFSSIDHQREAGESFIAGQASNGWVVSTTQYDDAGFSGSNTDRPALDRLLQDVAAGLVDAIVVYRLDRISRPIFDFARIIRHLNQHGCAFVSITEQFDTSTPQGKLHLNMMLSFSEFERELISARTRDKVIAARKRGRWTGGIPPLGYDLLPEGGGLVVNPNEAERVRAIFRLYIQQESLTGTLAELRERQWKTKSWTTKRGHTREGVPFQKGSLRRLLTNVTYRGQVLCKGEVYDGLHEGIVDDDLWDRVQRLLTTNGRTGGSGAKNRHGALLRGLIRCANCDAAMTHTFTKKRSRLYRYYCCTRAQKCGWDSCPTKSIPATEIERVIVERIQVIGKDRRLVRATVKAATDQLAQQHRLVQGDIRACERDLARLRAEEKQVFQVIGRGGKAAERAAVRLENIAQESSSLKDRLGSLTRHATDLEIQTINPDDLRIALESFSEIWTVLLPQERARIIHLLIQQVDYDGETGTLGITFHPVGIRALV